MAAALAVDRADRASASSRSGFLFNVLVVERVQSWTFHQYFNSHTLHEGGLAAGALAIGLGILPVIGGLASLWLPERFSDPPTGRSRPTCSRASSRCWLYTAAKSTYLLEQLSTRRSRSGTSSSSRRSC